MMDRFVFFGGKGGVGKTTISTAYALKCARAGLETLVVSTDPAHSISDVFDQDFDDEPRPVAGQDHLLAMEIDPEEAVDEHMMEIKRRLGDQVSPAIVNRIDRQIELAHQTPGAQEAALFDRFVEVMRNAGPYDRVVFDTSPTGGTLRLLSLPDFLEEWVERLVEKRSRSIDLYEKAAIGEEEARKKLETDPIIEHLRQRSETFEFAGRMLREESGFFLVLNPDELSIRETRRTVDQLSAYGLSVDGLVVNRVTPEPDERETGPGAEFLRERAATERERIEQIRTGFDQPVVGVVESRVREIKGDLLAAVAGDLDVEVEGPTPA